MATRRRGPRGSIPVMMKHSSGQARVCLSGQVHYLGKFGSAEAAARYAELVKRWEDGGRQPLKKAATVRTARSVADVLVDWERYLDDAGRYRKNGEETSQRGAVRVVVRDFCEMFGREPVSRFTERCLLRFRDRLEAKTELSRGGINRKIGILRAAFRWAYGRDLISRDQWLGVTSIEPLTRAEAGNRGRKQQKRAVTVEEVERVAACLPRVPAAMLRLQALTGMRPGEVCSMRWRDIDREGAEVDGVRCWVYTVSDGKTSHHGHSTTYALGPEAQRILSDFESANRDKPLFSPAQTMADVGVARRAARKTKVTEYTLRRDGAASREFGDRYSSMNYRQAIERACEKAGVARFTPHEVRHGFITRAAERFGAFAAASAANHRRVTTTEGYVHRQSKDALRVVVGLEADLGPRPRDDERVTMESRAR